MTRKGERARRRLVEAAWELSDARGPEAVLAGVSLRAVAARAGMSPAGLTYQFPTMRSLAIQMVEQLQESVSALPPEVIEALQDMAEQDGLAVAIRSAAQVNWDHVTSPAGVALQTHLLRTYSALGSPQDPAADQQDLRHAVGALTARRTAHLAALYEQTAARSGLQMVEPFTFRDLAVASNLLTDGFVHRWMCDDLPSDRELLSDLLVTLVTAMLTPSDRTKVLDEVATSLPGPSGEPEPHGSHQERLDEAARLGELFAGGIAAVTLTDLSRVLGCPVDRALARWGPVRTAAALSFSRHLPALREAVRRRAHRGADVSITDGCYELAKCVLADRHCAVALLHERVDARLAVPPDPWDVLGRVAIDGVLLEAFETVGGPCPTAQVALAVDLLLGAPGTSSVATPDDLAQLALRVLPPRT